MNIFRYGIVVLLCFSLGATINEIEMKFDGRISTCSTTEIFALTAENLTYNQLKAIQENHIKNNDDYLRCNLGDDDLCDPWWLDKSWKIKNSIERNYKDFVTDIRWQDFEPLRLGDWNTDYNFMKLTTLEKNSFNVPISWNILSDMDLYFCENYKIESSNCYWLEILFEMRKTKFRKCLRATLPRKIGDEPTGTCSTILQERDMELRTEGPGIVVKKDEFELSVTDLSYNPKKILSYIPKPSDFWKIRHIFAHLRKGEGTVKVHNYNFLETRKAGFHQIGRPFRTNDGWLCISIYVSMCRNCRMIFMMGGHVIADISFSSEGTWRHIKMYITDSKNSYEQLYVQTIGNELLPQFNYWAIDYVQLCQEKHFIFIPGQNSYRCTYASPLSAILTLKYNSSLSRVPLGFSGNKEDGVYNFQLTSKTKTKFNFRYQASNQKLTNNLTLELICQDREDLEQYEISKTVNVEKCESGSTFYCGSANLKGEKLNCTLRVVRKPGKRGREAYYGENIYFTNTEEAPLEPVDVRDSYNTNDNNIQIDSKKPINTNGELKGFEIRYIEAAISKKRLQENKLQSNVKNSTSASFTISTFSFEPCTQHFLQVRAVNNYSPGFASTKLTTSPPLLPNYLKIKKLKERITSVDFSFETPPKQISNDQEIIQYLLVLLTGTKKKCNKLKSMKIMNHEGLQNVSSIAREFDLTKVPVNVTVQFTIGDKTTGKSKYLNCDLENGPLEAKKTHQVAFLAISRCAYNSKKYVYTFDVTTGETEDTKLNISVIFYIILSIIWFLVGVASAISFKRYRERKRPKIMYGIGRRPTTVDNIYSLSDLPRILPKIPESDKEELLESHQNEFTTFPVAYRANLDFKKPIKIREFEKYVQNGVSKELEAQFLSLPKGALQPSVEGKQELNKPKNRFNNILPYDFNRVKLQRTSENTDYINASFIKGYKMNQSYIAAQGPKSLTINDFWQMIWQENVRYVVMLVNLEEAGQKKVEKYWPNPNEDFRFGNIQVFHHSADCMADYEINVFTVTCDGQQRKVFHYHFLKWPDHGVPMHFHTLVSFVRKSLEISLRSPVVVHCSSGTAATGVFILCDICLRAAHETGIVDMFKIAYDLRKQRINMIDNILQYKLAHLVVMEVLTGLQSVISCNDDVDKFTVKLTSPDELMLQMQYLEDTCWHNKVLQIPVGLDYPYEVFPKKNKTINIIPDETEAIQLRRYPPSDKSSAYINAVKVDGYNYQNKYIVTQQPMPNTLNDFWRMIVLLDVETIVSLNEVDLTDEKSCEFWPTDTNPQMSPVDFIMLKYSSHTESENFTKIGVQVHVEGKEKKIMKVNIISLKGWPTHNMFPDDLHNFLKFHCYIDVIMKQFPKCCVTCYDGNLACGLFVATSYIIEKIKLEKCYNVCEAIKIIRKNRKEFITDKKQLAYLYEIASTYIKGFETYANFSKASSALINIYDYIE